MKLRTPILSALAVAWIMTSSVGVSHAHEFTRELPPIYMTGAQVGTNVIGLGEEQLTCSTATVSGEFAEVEADVLDLTPAFGGHCTFEPNDFEVHVVNSDCTWQVTSDTFEEQSQMSLDCANEGSITITDESAICVVHIGDTDSEETAVNQGLAGLELDKAGGATEDLLLTVSLTGLHFTGTNFCPFVGIPATGTTGTYTGVMTVRGYADAEHEEQIDLTYH